MGYIFDGDGKIGHVTLDVDAILCDDDRGNYRTKIYFCNTPVAPENKLMHLIAEKIDLLGSDFIIMIGTVTEHVG